MKTEYTSYILISLVLSIFLLSSCGDDVAKGKEGVLHFELTYLDGENANPVITFLPNNMTYKFKNNKSVQRVEGWGGVFKMVGISDSKKDSVTALLKILGEKYKYQCKLGDDSFGYAPLDGIKIEYVEGTKEIAGFACKKAIGKYKDQEYELYYTNDIKIKNANWNTPFKGIDGVLLEYKVSMFNINTLIRATELERIKVDESEFDIPEGYTSVDKKKIEESVFKYM
jgi:GLPGLI family protein